VFFLLVIGVVAVVSTVAVVTDVKTDGFAYHARQQTMRLA
jgi:uncharacterized membrane protein